METTKRKKMALPKGMSPYPDLRMAIAMLNKRVETLSPERQMVVHKWIHQLEKIQKEMTHLTKIEQFTKNVKANLDEQREENHISH